MRNLKCPILVFLNIQILDSFSDSVTAENCCRSTVK